MNTTVNGRDHYSPWNSRGEFVHPTEDQLKALPPHLQKLYGKVSLAQGVVERRRGDLENVVEQLRNINQEIVALDDAIETRCAKLTPDQLRKNWVQEQNAARRRAHGLR